jgi:hypothetical protein
VFAVRGVRDARILLSSDDASEPIEIVIGGSHNPATGSSVSMIRGGVQPIGSTILEPDLSGPTYTESGILSPDEDRFFWIYWSEQVVAVGKVRRSGPLCGWPRSEMLPRRNSCANPVNSSQGTLPGWETSILRWDTPLIRFTSLSVSTWESGDSTAVTWSFLGMVRGILGPRLVR